MENSRQSLEEYNQNIDKTTSANLAQIDSVSKLKNELTTLVDENGKVKEGYESRVSFILNELNNALGTEYKLNGNVVQGYKDLQGEIDKTIEKKRAEIKLNAEEEKYKNAIENQKEAVEKLKTAQENLGESIDTAKQKYQKYTDAVNEAQKNGDTNAQVNLSLQKKEMDALKDKISAYENAEWEVKDYTTNIKKYEEDYANFTEGKYNEIGKTITDTTKNWTNSSVEEIRNSITQQQDALNQYKQIYETTGSEVAQQQMQQAQQNLQNLADELVSRTSTIDSLGTEEVLAWKNLANNSYEEYKNAISKMSPEMQQKIQDVTGVIVSDTGLSNATSSKATEMTSMFDKKLGLGGRTKQEINNSADSIKNDTTVQTEAGNLGKKVDTSFNDKLDGFKWAWDLVKNIYEGLTNPRSRDKISEGSNILASIIDSILGFSLPEQGPLSNFDKSMPDMIDLMSKGIDSNKTKVINSAEKLAKDLNDTLRSDIKLSTVQDFGKLQGSLSREIANNTKVINNNNKITFQICPQQLTEAELNKAVDYLNKKLGQYL